jgi:hypothetical protein
MHWFAGENRMAIQAGRFFSLDGFLLMGGTVAFCGSSDP